MTSQPRTTPQFPARFERSVTFSPIVGRIEQPPGGGVTGCRRQGQVTAGSASSYVPRTPQLPGGDAVGDFSNHGAHWARQMNADQIARAEQHARNAG